MSRKPSRRQETQAIPAVTARAKLAHDTATNDHVERSRGLFDGYEEYRTASKEDFREVLLKGLVVPDTSVLLNLYRYNTRTRSQLLAALGRLNTLWVPSQVIGEFWRNRLATIRDSREISRRAISNLEQKSKELIAVIGSWVNSRGADPAIKADLAAVVESALGELAARIEAITEAETIDIPEDTNSDPVVASLETLVAGKVGPAFTPEERQIAVKEADRRIECREPPGYKDKGKGLTPQGDYLIWKQILMEASRRRSNVLFITGDQKEDWWRIGSGGELLGPRGELVSELLTQSGGRLYLLTPERFLGWARDLLGAEVSEESLADAGRVDRRIAGLRPVDWTDEEAAVFDTLDEDDERVSIEQLPEGATGSYVDVLGEMCEIADGAPSVEVYLDRFQEHFPRITLRTEARRRMATLIKLGLASSSSGRVVLTDLGKSFSATKDSTLIQSAFLTKIRGARELLGMARNNDVSTLRLKIRNATPEALSQSQATRILRWLEQLDLIGDIGDDQTDE